MAALLRLQAALSLVVLALSALHRSQERAGRVNIIRERATHSARLERWLGAEQCELLSASMRDWYGPPIAVANAPGSVWAHKGGDFRGPLRSGGFASLADYAAQRAKRAALSFARNQRATANVGITSLSQAIRLATTPGKRDDVYFHKNSSPGTTPSPIGIISWFGESGHPPSGSKPAAPNGAAPTAATTGALVTRNPAISNGRYVVGATIASGTPGNTSPTWSLLYDRIFHVKKTMNSTATESVTGVPTRYQSATPGAIDYAGGNFLCVEASGASLLSATAHNWTVCKYTDQDGNTGATLPSLAGQASLPHAYLDHPARRSTWFAPLASDDVGIKALEQMQCDALVSTIADVGFVIGHPIAWLSSGNTTALVMETSNLLSGPLPLVPILDDAALALLSIQRTTNADLKTSGQITLLHS